MTTTTSNVAVYPFPFDELPKNKDLDKDKEEREKNIKSVFPRGVESKKESVGSVDPEVRMLNEMC